MLLYEHDFYKRGIPKCFFGKTFKDYKGSGCSIVVKKKIKKYMQTFRIKRKKGKGLYIWGPPNAKTGLLAHLIAFSGLAYGFDVFSTTLEKLTQLKFDSENTGVFEELVEKEILIIDGLEKSVSEGGVLYLNDGMRNALYQTLSSRAKNMLPVVISSSLSLFEFEKEFGESTAYLIQENCQEISASLVD